MPRQRIFLVETQAVFDGKARGAELPEIVEEDRHVDMGAPFPRPWLLLKRGDGVVNVEKLRQLAVLLLNRLRQINGLSIALHCVDDVLRHFRYVQRGGFLELEDR